MDSVVEEQSTTEIARKPALLRRILNGLIGLAAFLISWTSLGLAGGVLILIVLVSTFGKDLPNHDQLSEYAPPTISRIFSREGDLMDEFAKERRLFSPIEEIPDLVKHAMISAEDKHFYSHAGFDPVGIVKAGFEAMQGGRLRGASTITQQVMKNFLLSNERTLERKIKEIFLAVRLESTLTKDQILELYLNEIFLGQNSYGVTAAAQTYFNKPLRDLSIGEAAYLASLPKAPSSYHPVRQKERAIARRNFVIQEMIENGYVDETAGQIAIQSDLATVQNGDFRSFNSALPPRGYFTDEIRRQLAEDFGEDEFFGGGLTIRATVDPELQATAENALRAGLEKYDRGRGVWRGTGIRFPSAVLASEESWREELEATTLPRDVDGWYPAVVLEVQSDKAIVGVEDHAYPEASTVSANQLDWVQSAIREDGSKASVKRLSDFLAVGDVVMASPSMDGSGTIISWELQQIPEVQGAFMAMDVNSGRILAMQGGFSYQYSVFNRATQATRQPGSAFKPFVYAAALDSGYTPATIVVDAPIEMETPEGIWRPTNSNEKFFGPSPIRTGIEMSRNLMTIRLAREVGMEQVAQYAEEFGIYESMDEFLANSLGAQETTLYQMVSGYAMFANGGERVKPTLVDRVQNRRGETIYKHDPRLCIDCSQHSLPKGQIPEIISNRLRVIDAITAYQITSMMKGVVERGTASRTVKTGFPVAGKTGTTNDSRDAWFVGYTPDIVAGCYIGFDLPRSLGRRAYGSSLCGPVFNEFIIKAAERYGSAEFKVPEGGTFVNINRITGELYAGGEDTETNDLRMSEFFRFGTEPLPGKLNVIDGGFAMASDLEIFDPKSPAQQGDSAQGNESAAAGLEGQQADEEAERGSFGSISSGGLY